MDATQHRGWGGVGHVNVPCNLHALWLLRNTGVGVGHVNVPCNLERLADGSAMLRPGMEPVEEVRSQGTEVTRLDKPP